MPAQALFFIQNFRSMCFLAESRRFSRHALALVIHFQPTFWDVYKEQRAGGHPV